MDAALFPTEIESRCQVCNRPLRSPASTSRGMGPVCEEHVGQCPSPFTIIVDSNESKPYEFNNIREDANRGNALIVPRIKVWPLWTIGLADYSIDGYETEIQIERKSKSDLYSTLGSRRNLFENQIRRMHETCRIAFVVIEAEWPSLLFQPPERSKLNPKTVARTIDSWSIKYPKVHWLTCCGRRHAEVRTYRLLDLFWRKKT